MFVFKDLRLEFNDIITTLQAQVEPITFDDLQSLLLTGEYMRKSQAVSPDPMAFFFASGYEPMLKSSLEPPVHLGFSLAQLAYFMASHSLVLSSPRLLY